MFNEKLHKNLIKALAEAGFEEPKELQESSIPKINGGFDVIGIGPEGSGRSTLISIMAVQKLQRAFEDPPRAFVLVADKEKAIAMKAQFDLFAKYTDLRSVCVHEDGKIDE